MEVTKIIAELRKERDQIEEAIISLERLARSGGARRGRPPAWLAAAKKGTRQARSKKKGAAAKAVAAVAP
jgi:ABC-type transporter Mla subunit MlaD